MSWQRMGLALFFAAVVTCGGGTSPGAPAGDILFKSDWSDGTVTDGGAWSVASARQEVVSTSGLDMPTPNALKQTYVGGSPMQAVYLQVPGSDGALPVWPVPDIGESLYFRVYHRVDWRDLQNLSGNGFHWIQPMPGRCPSEWQWIIEPNGNGTFDVRYGLSLHEPGYVGRFGPVTLNEDTTYRYEWRIHRTGSNTWQMEIRVYGPDGALVLDTDDVPGLRNAIGNFGDVDCLGSWLLGMNGGEVIADDSYQYWAAACVRGRGWCGAYNEGI